MPTAMTILGVRVAIFLNDHRPAHVHLIGQGHEAVLDLHCPSGPPSLRENYGFSRSDLRRLMTAVAPSVAILCAKWRKVHGPY
ncbi:DUF4160 domain-containing protein [Duganella callida]|uniref:DUF4160 domain-containing protein n=2 Tax=Duganella callida TaxID=2561932 RepID=A0A4Y9S190_9BURK|nr:DUF4160 domain-containing protein [Duganella callida]